MMTLLPDHWYACEFIPEDPLNDERMYSPIRIQSIRTFKDGSGRLQLAFYHANYPEGVRDKLYDLRVVLRTPTSFLAVRSGTPPLVLLIHELDAAWLAKQFDIRVPLNRDISVWLSKNV